MTGSNIIPPAEPGAIHMMQAGKVTDATELIRIELVVITQIIPAGVGELDFPCKSITIPPESEAPGMGVVVAGGDGEGHDPRRVLLQNITQATTRITPTEMPVHLKKSGQKSVL